MKRILTLMSLVFLVSICEAQTILVEGFETWPPTDWEIFLEGPSTRGWRQDFENISYTGDHSADSNISNNQMDNWLVSPPINIINADFELKFWELYEDIAFYDKSSVHISIGSSDPADGDYVEVYETSTLNTVDWEQQTIGLSAYNGETIYVAFRHQGTFHQWFVDDVTVSPSNFSDAALLQFNSPFGVSETPGFRPILIQLQNFGTTVIDDYTISWEINSVPQTDFIGSGLNLQPGESTQVNLGNYNFDTEGNYELVATIDLLDDFDPTNNQISTTYQVASFKDGAIVAVSPEGMIPNPVTLDVIVDVTNLGMNTINIAEVIWSVNGIEQTPFSTDNLNLASGETTQVNLGQYDFISGINNLVFTLNAIGDNILTNNVYNATVPVDVFWESFEGANFPPEGWSINFGVRDDINFDEPVEGNYYYASQPANGFFGVVNDTLYTPLLDISNGNRFTFYIKSSLAQSTQNTLVWKDGITGEVNTIANIPNSPGFNQWELRDIDISAAAGINQIGIVTTTSGDGLTKFDLFTSDAKLHQFDNDLKVVNGDMYYLARQNQSEGFTCTIKNSGEMPVSGSEYTVKLMESPNTELASTSGVSLTTLQESEVTVNHTFTTISNKRLFFEIEYANDQNTANNTFREANVSVVPSTVELSTIGTLDSSLFLPFTQGGSSQTLGQDDISEAMYYSDEFNSPGFAYGVAYKYNNLLDADLATKYPLKVWATQTNLDNLEGGWTPNEELVLVFDGIVEILPGDNRDLYIPFDQPVLINGIENLVIRSYQFDPEWPPSIVRFLGSNTNMGPIRTIGALEVFDLDPDNPPTDFFQSQAFNYVQFVVDPSTSNSVLTGTVYDSSTNNPIENASITIEGSTISAQTDINGAYSLPALPYGSYDITASFSGYQDELITVDLNTANQIQDFYLDLLNEVEVIGTVYGSNATSTPLESVTVSLLQNGSIVETVTTNANGDFIFPVVFGGFDYEVSVSLYGYFEETFSISPDATNIDLGDIILDEEFISPFDVSVTSDTEPTVNWKSPKLSSKVKLQEDFGVISFSYTNSPGENVWLGNIFEINEITTLNSVEIQTDVFLLASEIVTIDIIDMASNEVIATSEPFIMEQDALLTISIPNIVVSDDIAAMVHWQNNFSSTNALAIDYSDPNITNAAAIRYPGEAITLFSEFIGITPNTAAFHVRINTLDDGTPTTNSEVVTYNVYRGLASEFPDTSNWDLLNTSPLSDISLIDMDLSTINPNENYRYAVETIYNQGLSEVTFSNEILGDQLLSVDDLEALTSKVFVFPNPTSDTITIRLEGGLQLDRSVEVYDILGKQVIVIHPSDFINGSITLNVNSLEGGMYIIKMNINGLDINKKFIKE